MENPESLFEEGQSTKDNFTVIVDGREIVYNHEDMILCQEALWAYENHDYQDALKKFNLLIEKNENDFQYYKFRGTVYEDMGDESRAFQDFRKAVDLCPTDSVALFRLAMVYYNNGDLQTAIEYLRKAYENTPTYDDLLGISYNNILFVHKKVIACNLANFLTQTNRMEEGLRLLDEVIFNCPDYSFPYFVKALALTNMGLLRGAVPYARKAAELGLPQAVSFLSFLNTLQK